ncbi:MAG: succinylglutamate desuccinylase [Proteobacteria bacterium]|nr:MAG: succinylglutamate desuccinylase [Pseudomonadota bacterium]PIE40244.1 MAG: succinylglutamate desuccinylase [Gammaproteobacteria bacterium]
MKLENRHIRLWEHPKPSELGNSVEAFLKELGQPALITIPGRNPNVTRAISTLLHGNEPSGLKAVYRWLKQGSQPAVNIICFICSIKTAQRPPGFFYRHLPDMSDPNRCFSPARLTQADKDEAGLVAAEFVDILDFYKPECVIDIHNTSGKGPDFAVSITADRANMEIGALFTSRMIITDLRLGALMELSSVRMPVVTIECGGSEQEESTEMAFRGLERYVGMESFLSDSSSADHDNDRPLYHSKFETLHNPIRVELTPEATIEYHDQNHPEVDVTLLSTIENDNFGIIKPDDSLGWLNGELKQTLKAVNSRGDNIIEHVLTVKDGQLYPARPIKMFMATTNPAIAKSDCLFYIVNNDGKEFLRD